MQVMVTFPILRSRIGEATHFIKNNTLSFPGVAMKPVGMRLFCTDIIKETTWDVHFIVSYYITGGQCISSVLGTAKSSTCVIHALIQTEG